MFTFGLIAVLGFAQADTPKKKSEKTEESKSSKKSSDSKSSSKSSKKPAPKNKSTSKSSSKTAKPAAKKPVPKKTSTSKSSSKTAKPAVQKSTPKKTSNTAQKKSSQRSPTGKVKTNGNPAKQRTGQEQPHGSAHKPLGARTTTNKPSYHRAPNNVDRSQVGKEQRNTPNAHSPIGNSTGHRNPTYDRAPNDVPRPEVGKERNNSPTAHEPIGGRNTRPERGRPTRQPEGQIDRKPPTQKESNRPERNIDRNPPTKKETNRPERNIDRNPPTKKETNRPERTHPNREVDQPRNDTIERQPPSRKESTRPEKGGPTRQPEGQIDRKPPTRKESNRPERNRPNRSNETSNTPNQNIDRINPSSEPCTECPSQTVSPGKSQHRNAYNGGFNTSTRQQTTRGPDRPDMGAWGFGLGTLSFASDYVDGGAYQDGGLGMSLGFRLIPQFEIEGSYGHYTDSTLESSRNRLNRPIQLVGQVHPFPDAVVSPFVSGGYVWNNIVIDDEYIADGENKTAEQDGWLTGLALGAGVTFNVHQSIALELDGRLFQYNNLEYWDDAGDTATLVSMGVVVGF